MHDLLVEVLPYLAAFFLLDGIVLLAPYHLVFARSFGRTRVCENGLQLLPFAPTSEALAAIRAPVLVSAKGVWFPIHGAYLPRVFEPTDLHFVPFDELETTVEGKKLVARGTRLLDAPSPELLKRLRADLEALRKEAPEKRPALHREQLSRATELARFTERRGRVRRLALQTGLFGSVTAACFLALLVLVQLGDQRLLAAAMMQLVETLGLSLLGSTLTGAALLVRAGQPPGDAVGRVLMFVLLPFQALRPLHHLTRELYADFHWSALAAGLLDRDRFLRLAREELWRIDQSARIAGDEALAEAWRMARFTWESLLRQLGAPVEEVVADPSATDEESAGYCPLCSAEYREGFQVCSECAVELRPLGAPHAAQRRAS